MIVHSYARGEWTREDIEGVMGEPTGLPWFDGLTDRIPAGCDCVHIGGVYDDAVWEGAGTDGPTAFGVHITENKIALSVDVRNDGVLRYEDAAFMSEARSALARRLGCVWVDFDDGD